MAEGEVDKLGIIIFGFLVIFLGIVFSDVIGDSLSLATTLSPITNESVLITASAGQLANDDISAVSLFANVSVDLTDNLTIDVNISRAGAIVTSEVVGNNTYNVSYTFEGDEYVVGARNRTILNLVIIFFVIAVLLIAILVFTKTGIMELITK